MECTGVPGAVDHFRLYMAGRQFKVVADSSTINWLFRSREVCPKLRRWALRLTEYDMVLAWRAGVQRILPEALSRLSHVQNPQADVDDSFPDDFTSGAPSELVGPRGPRLDGVRLAEGDAAGGDGG